jgi:hypothetical protein
MPPVMLETVREIKVAERERLVGLVETLLSGGPLSEAEQDAVLEDLRASTLHPRVTDLIYYWQDDFDHEPTAEEIVDRALAHRPFAAGSG